MTESESTAAAGIREALYSAEQIESVERIKDFVSASLRAADTTISRIVRTSHFNHSFSPDLVVEWPSGSAKALRPVYLRSTQNPGFVAEDVALVDAPDAIFFALDDWRLEADGAPLGLVDESARSHDSLVTRVEAVEAIGSDRANRPGVGLFASAIVSSGRGLIEADRARITSSEVSEGFLGAQRADRQLTAQAVQTIDAALQRGEADRLTDVMQAVWTAAGGSATEFPSDAPQLSGRISTQSLKFLLEFEEVEDPAFWRRLARAVDFEVLIGMGSIAATPAFQRFMRAAAGRLRARACKVTQIGGLSADDGWQWSLAESTLVLDHPKLTAFVGAKLGELPDVGDELPGMALGQVRARAERIDTPVVELAMFDGQNSLTYRSEVGAGVIPDAQSVPAVDEFFGPGMVVRRALLDTASGHKLEVNYSRSSGAATGGRAHLPANELIWSSSNMLVDLVDSERSQLRELLGFNDASLDELITREEAGE